MTGNELKTFVEIGLESGSMNETVFYQLLNIAKTKIEEERNWKILEKEDTTKTANAGDTFLSMKDLPTDFGNDIELFITDGNNNPTWYSSIPFRKRYAYKDASRRYYIDLANNQFALTGKVNTSKTIHLIYKSSSPDISSDSSWVFPARFHPLLGFLVAEMQKSGVDWDTINARQALQNRADALALYGVLLMWDDNLRAKELGNRYEPAGISGYDNDGLPSEGFYELDLGTL